MKSFREKKSVILSKTQTFQKITVQNLKKGEKKNGINKGGN